MYEIDVCYKIIFEAMLEKPALKSIAEKINEYTGAKIIFVSGAGKILAYSHTFEQDSSESVKWSHVTFSEYEKFLQVVLKKGITAKQLQERLHDVFQDSGVSVWQCQFV